MSGWTIKCSDLGVLSQLFFQDSEKKKRINRMSKLLLFRIFIIECLLYPPDEPQ